MCGTTHIVAVRRQMVNLLNPLAPEFPFKFEHTLYLKGE